MIEQRKIVRVFLGMADATAATIHYRDCTYTVAAGKTDLGNREILAPRAGKLIALEETVQATAAKVRFA